jgi:hypothetical protein
MEYAVAKPNYQHMKKQREAAKKARQQEKITRKLARSAEPEPAATDQPGEAAGNAEPTKHE